MRRDPVRRPAEFIRLGLQGTVGADAQIVIGQQAVNLRHVIRELGLTPVHLQPFYLFMGRITMRKDSMRLNCRAAGQYEDEEQSADRGKQPTMLGMSAHKRSRMLVRVRITSQK